MKDGLKLLKNEALEVIPKYGRTEGKVRPKVAERIIYETLQLILALYFKMLSFISNFSEEISLYLLASLLLWETP